MFELMNETQNNNTNTQMYKKENKDNASIYRGVILMNRVYKIYTEKLKEILDEQIRNKHL